MPGLSGFRRRVDSVRDLLRSEADMALAVIYHHGLLSGSWTLKEFTREPTRAERVLGIVLSALLSVVFGGLTYLFARHGPGIAAVVTGTLFGVVVVFLYRAAFGTRRALNRNASYKLAWALMLFGAVGFAIYPCIPDGPFARRLMLLSGSTTVFSAGLAGVRGRRNRA